jgi:predicted nucleic acid-binding protein
MIIIDTNVIIRYLTGDDPEKAKKFRSYLRKNSGLFVSDTVVAETYFVLTSFYKFSRDKVLSWLSDLICHPNIQCDEGLLKEVIEIAASHDVSFVDAYCAALARKQTNGKLLSYDKSIGKIAGVTRIEP